MSDNYNDNIGFLQIDARLTMITGFKHKATGDVIKFDGTDFKIIAFMQQRENYFKNTGKGKYFESLDRICLAATGSKYTNHGGNKERVKKLFNLGLIVIATTKTGKFQQSGPKHVNSLDDMLKTYDLVNSTLTLFDTPEAADQRKEDKKQRLDDQKIRVEQREDANIQQLVTEQMPISWYESIYKSDEDNTDEQPPILLCEEEVIGHLSLNVPVVNDKSRDYQDEDYESSILPGDDEFSCVTPAYINECPVIGDSLDESCTMAADKTILESYIDHGVIDDIPPSFGIGWFASPLSKNELDRNTTVKYLSILHKRGLWDEYNPDQNVVDSIYNVLSAHEEPEGSSQNYGFEGDPMFRDFISGWSEIPSKKGKTITTSSFKNQYKS